MLFKNLTIVHTISLISIILFSTSCSENADLYSPPANIDLNQIIEKSNTAMASLNSYQLNLTHITGIGTPIGETGLKLLEASALIKMPGEIHIEATLLFGNLILKTEYIRTESQSYYLNPLTQKWEEINDVANPLALAADGLNEILFSTIGKITNPKLDYSDSNNYVIKGFVSSNIFSLLLEKTLTNQLSTTLHIDRETHFVHKIEISGPASKYDAPEIIRKLTISNFNKPLTISNPELK